MKISIVIPCRNEKQYVHECIEAILSSKGIDDIEKNIYIVDGMSDDGTREEIHKITATHNNIHLIDNPKKLTPFAFNLGIHAGGKVDFVQIIGARQIISDNYLAKCMSILQADSSIWCVGGKIINQYTTPTGEMISKVMSTSFGMGLGNFRTLEKSGFTDTVTSPMYPYWVFEKIGFFDEALIRNQDDDFNFRVTQAGGKIYYEHAISLKYYVRTKIKGLWRQFFQYGYWKVFVNKKHKTITTFRQMIPPLFVVYILILPFTLLLNSCFAWFSIPLLFYVLIGGYFAFKISDTIRKIPQIFCIFPILHFSYGFGYLSGIIDFYILKKNPKEKQKRLSR